MYIARCKLPIDVSIDESSYDCNWPWLNFGGARSSWYFEGTQRRARYTKKCATVRVDLLTYGAAQESLASSKDGGDDDHGYTGGSWTIIADIERPRPP
jgi:hypothetical protein